MTAAVMPFQFDNKDVRIVTRDGDPWFVLTDVCRILEIGNPSMTASKLDNDEKGVSSIDTLGGPQNVVIISESGFYTIVLRSRDAVVPGSVAHRFRRWVTNEVLPAIRKSGRYAAAPDFGTGPSTTERQARLALDQITEIRMTFGVPAARAAWRRLGLVHVEEMTGTLSDTDRVLAAIREYGGMVTRTTLTGRVLRFMSAQTLDGVLANLVDAGIVEVHRPARKGQGRRATFYRMAA